ncbi:MAG: double-strand break repair protein AddB [Pseudomonadota bacterium]
MHSLYTIPPDKPFLRTLARAVLDGVFHDRTDGHTSLSPDEFALADTTILLPTRRAARALQDAFLDVSPDRALLLPEIRPISEGDEDGSLISAFASRDAAVHEAALIPSAIEPIARQLLLAKLIQEWAAKASPLTRDPEDQATILSVDTTTPDAASQKLDALTVPSQAVRLAHDLGVLIDLLDTEQVDLKALEHLSKGEFAAHWQITQSLLDIVNDAWPETLDHLGLISPADRRNRVLAEEARLVASRPKKAPVIIAGITGSIPATITLMRAVGSHPLGAIILPALDHVLDDASFDAIRPADRNQHHFEHPQFGLKAVLDRLGVVRTDVTPLEIRNAQTAAPSGPAADGPNDNALKLRVLSEALRPSDTTDRWSKLSGAMQPQAVRDALDAVSLIAAPTALDEAEVVALILREALETEGQTAALVSPDRLLARRVATRLKTWGVDVDDSAGRPFRKTPPGTLIELALTVIEANFEAASIAALLKHPLLRLGLAAGPVRQAARNLEVAALRSGDLGPGLEGLRNAVDLAHDAASGETGKRQSRPVRLMKDKPDDWAAIRDLLDRLDAAFAPLRHVFAETSPQPLHVLTDALMRTCEALAEPLPLADQNEAVSKSSDEEIGATQSPLWQGEDGELAAQIFARLLDTTLATPDITPRGFPEVYRALTARETVRQTTRVHPRLSIWGPYEARLQMPDIVILGGLNDGTWPQVGETGPWLNRPMRDLVGLPQPEEEIGRAAHDFVSLCGAPTVYLTRAEKVDGSPTVPSRWLLRLQTVLAGCGAADALEPDRPWVHWALARHHAKKPEPVAPPKPRPAIALRPKQVSVTDVETWIANPYALYARKILQLEPLDPIGVQPDARMRGTLVHEALGAFARKFPKDLPNDTAEQLTAIARQLMAAASVHPVVRAFWLPRFERFSAWFAATEPERRDGVLRTLSEANGAVAIAGETSNLRLTARADRIDIREDGIAIYDYKGGGQSTLKSMSSNAGKLISPQLPLEAAIAIDGGFKGVPATADISHLAYISTQGGNPAGSEIALKSETTLEDMAGDVREKLAALSDVYADPSTPYAAIRRPSFDYQYDAYEQLARVKEWNAGDTDADTAEGGA